MSNDLYFSRRAALRFAGKASLVLPLQGMFSKAYGAPAAAKRLVIIGGELPASNLWWQPKGTETQWDISFSGATLAPLAPFKDQMLVLHGLGYKGASDLYGGVENHENRSVALTATTNNNTINANIPMGQSIDALVAGTIGETKPFFGGIDYIFSNALTSAKLVGNQLVAPTREYRWHQEFFDALLKGVTPSDPSTPPQNLPKHVARRSMLDLYAKQLQALKGRASSLDKARLDQHLTGVREIEQKLASGETAQPVGAGCTIPSTAGFRGSAAFVNGQAATEYSDMYYKIMAHGLGCNSTRVMCFHHSAVPSHHQFTGQVNRFGNTIKDNDDDFHQSVAHASSPYLADKDTAEVLRIRDVNLDAAKSIAKFVQQLKDTQDADGKSVLDNTLIVWMGQMSDPSSHLAGRIPIVLLGGAGVDAGTMRMGRYLDYTNGIQPKTVFDLMAKNNSTAHNGLLVSIANTFGSNIENFGRYNDSSFARGPLARLK